MKCKKKVDKEVAYSGRIHKEISRGSFGVVYKARTADNRCCAIKIPHPHILSSKKALENYKTEIKMLSSLDHPSIITFLDVFYADNNLPLLVMEIMWISLYSVIEQRLPLPFLIKLHILHDVTVGLVYLQNKNIIHRDLTLSNILLNKRMDAKITDLGNAQQLDTTKCDERCSVPGNSLYMPPESFASNPVCGLKLDVFSFGCITTCLVNETIPSPEDPFSEVNKANKYLENMPSEFPLLKELAASCLACNSEDRPDIECVRVVLNTIISSVCTASINEHEVQVHCTSSVKKNFNIAKIASRKKLKYLKEQDSSKTVRCYEILVNNSSILNFFKCNVPKSGKNMWLHNLSMKFDQVLIEEYLTYLESRSIYFLKCFFSVTQPDTSLSNLNTFSYLFSSTSYFKSTSFNMHTFTVVSYYVAFSQSNSEQNQIIEVSFSKKQVTAIITSTVTEKIPIAVQIVPTVFNGLLANICNNKHFHLPLRRREASWEGEVSQTEPKYCYLQTLLARPQLMEAVPYIQQQFLLEEMSLKFRIPSVDKWKCEKPNLASFGELICLCSYICGTDSLLIPNSQPSNPVKPNAIVKKCLPLPSGNANLYQYFANILSFTIAIKIEFSTFIYSKESTNLSHNVANVFGYFGLHVVLVAQWYHNASVLCRCQCSLCIYIYYYSNVQLITTGQAINKHVNTLLSITGFYSYFAADSVQERFLSIQYTYRTLALNTISVYNADFVESSVIADACNTSQAVMQCKSQNQLKILQILICSTFQWVSDLMPIDNFLHLALCIFLDKISYSFALDSQLNHTDVGSKEFFGVIGNDVDTEAATSISTYPNRDHVMKIDLCTKQIQSTALYVHKETLAGQPSPEILSDASNLISCYYNISNRSHCSEQKSVDFHTTAKQDSLFVNTSKDGLTYIQTEDLCRISASESVFTCQHKDPISEMTECLYSYLKPIVCSCSNAESSQLNSQVITSSRLHVTGSDHVTPVSFVTINQCGIVGKNVKSSSSGQIFPFCQSEKLHIAVLVTCKLSATSSTNVEEHHSTPTYLVHNFCIAIAFFRIYSVISTSTQSYHYCCHIILYNVCCKGSYWHKSFLFLCLTRQKLNFQCSLHLCIYDSAHTQLVLTPHFDHQSCINLCSGQAIASILCSRLQDYIFQGELNTILHINAKMLAFLDAVKLHMSELQNQFLSSIVAYSQNMLYLASSIFSCRCMHIESATFKWHKLPLAANIQCLEIVIIQDVNNSQKKAVEVCENNKMLPVSVIFEESNSHKNASQTVNIKFTKVNVNLVVVPNRQNRDVTLAQKCLANAVKCPLAVEAPRIHDTAEFIEELDEWLFLHNHVNVKIINAFIMSYQFVPLLENKLSHKSLLAISPSKSCFIKSDSAERFVNLLSTKSMEVLVYHESFNYEIKSFIKQYYGHTEMSIQLFKLIYCRCRYLVTQVISYQHCLQYIFYSQALAVTSIIKYVDQVLYIVNYGQICVSAVVEVMQYEQYIFSSLKFNVVKPRNTSFLTLTVDSDVYKILHINTQQKRCSWFSASRILPKVLHPSESDVFNNTISQLKHSCVDVCDKPAIVHCLIDIQAFVSPKAHIHNDDHLCSLNDNSTSIDQQHHHHVTANYGNTLSTEKHNMLCTMERLSSCHDEWSLNTTPTTITNNKQITTLQNNVTEKCTHEIPLCSSIKRVKNFRGFTVSLNQFQLSYYPYSLKSYWYGVLCLSLFRQYTHYFQYFLHLHIWSNTQQLKCKHKNQLLFITSSYIFQVFLNAVHKNPQCVSRNDHGQLNIAWQQNGFALVSSTVHFKTLHGQLFYKTWFKEALLLSKLRSADIYLFTSCYKKYIKNTLAYFAGKCMLFRGLINATVQRTTDNGLKEVSELQNDIINIDTLKISTWTLNVNLNDTCTDDVIHEPVTHFVKNSEESNEAKNSATELLRQHDAVLFMSHKLQDFVTSNGVTTYQNQNVLKSTIDNTVFCQEILNMDDCNTNFAYQVASCMPNSLFKLLLLLLAVSDQYGFQRQSWHVYCYDCLQVFTVLRIDDHLDQLVCIVNLFYSCQLTVRMVLILMMLGIMQHAQYILFYQKCNVVSLLIHGFVVLIAMTDLTCEILQVHKLQIHYQHVSLYQNDVDLIGDTFQTDKDSCVVKPAILCLKDFNSLSLLLHSGVQVLILKQDAPGNERTCLLLFSIHQQCHVMINFGNLRPSSVYHKATNFVHQGEQLFTTTLLIYKEPVSTLVSTVEKHCNTFALTEFENVHFTVNISGFICKTELSQLYFSYCTSKLFLQWCVFLHIEQCQVVSDLGYCQYGLQHWYLDNELSLASHNQTNQLLCTTDFCNDHSIVITFHDRPLPGVSSCSTFTDSICLLQKTKTICLFKSHVVKLFVFADISQLKVPYEVSAHLFSEIQFEEIGGCHTSLPDKQKRPPNCSKKNLNCDSDGQPPNHNTKKLYFSSGVCDKSLPGKLEQPPNHNRQKLNSTSDKQPPIHIKKLNSTSESDSYNTCLPDKQKQPSNCKEALNSTPDGQPPNQKLHISFGGCDTSLPGNQKQSIHHSKQKSYVCLDVDVHPSIRLQILNANFRLSVGGMIKIKHAMQDAYDLHNGIFPIHSKEIQSCQNTHDNNDGDRNNTSNNNNKNNNNDNKNNNNNNNTNNNDNKNNHNNHNSNSTTDKERCNTHPNVRSGGSGNNDDDDDEDGSNSENGEILSALIYFLQLGQLLLLLMVYRGRLYLAICQLLHVQSADECTVFNSCISGTVSLGRHQLTMLGHQKIYVKLTCRSVNNAKTVTVVLAHGKLSYIWKDRQPSMVFFKLHTDILVLHFDNNIRIRSLLINTIRCMRYHQSPSQSIIHTQLVCLTDPSIEQVIGTNNEKRSTKKCMIYKRNSTQAKLCFIFQVGKCNVSISIPFHLVVQLFKDIAAWRNSKDIVVSLHHSYDGSLCIEVTLDNLVIMQSMIGHTINCRYHCTTARAIQYPAVVNRIRSRRSCSTEFVVSDCIIQYPLMIIVNVGGITTYALHQSPINNYSVNNALTIGHDDLADSRSHVTAPQTVNPVPIQQYPPHLDFDDDHIGNEILAVEQNDQPTNIQLCLTLESLNMYVIILRPSLTVLLGTEGNMLQYTDFQQHENAHELLPYQVDLEEENERRDLQHENADELLLYPVEESERGNDVAMMVCGNLKRIIIPNENELHNGHMHHQSNTHPVTEDIDTHQSNIYEVTEEQFQLEGPEGAEGGEAGDA